ncbi:MAG: hypothetical protein IJJ98_13665 [Prevotella sp.]|nr:hypothetical protein [Prevotella sp.]
MYNEQTEEKSNKSSLQLLNEKFESVREKYADKEDNSFWDSSPESKCYNEMAQIVIAFTIPNTKEDLLDILPYLKTQSELKANGRNARFVEACEAKYKECVLKAKTSFKDDPAFEPYLREKTLLEKVLGFFK